MDGINKNNQVSELYETGRLCPKCSRQLMAGMFFNQEVKILCECQVEKRKLETEDKKAKQRAETVQQLRRTSGLPLAQENCTFESYERRPGTQDAIAVCQRYADHFNTAASKGVGLRIFGTNGSGKTHLAAAISNVLLDKGCSIKWYPIYQFYRDLKRCMDDRNYREADVIDSCTKPRLLVLDDIGAEKPTGWTQSALFSVIDYRCSHLKPTVITTNLNEGDAYERLGTQIADRFYDKRFYTPVNLSVSSFRRKA